MANIEPTFSLCDGPMDGRTDFFKKGDTIDLSTARSPVLVFMIYA